MTVLTCPWLCKSVLIHMAFMHITCKILVWYIKQFQRMTHRRCLVLFIFLFNTLMPVIVDLLTILSWFSQTCLGVYLLNQTPLEVKTKTDCSLKSQADQTRFSTQPGWQDYNLDPWVPDVFSSEVSCEGSCCVTAEFSHRLEVSGWVLFTSLQADVVWLHLYPGLLVSP